MSLSLANRLFAYIELFSKRTDIKSFEFETDWDHKGLGYSGLKKLRTKMNPELLAFVKGLNGVTFTWAFQDKADQVDEFVPGGCGGRINIRDLGPEEFYFEPGTNWYIDASSAASVLKFEEQIADQALVFLALKEETSSSKDTFLFFWNYPEQEGADLGSIEEYLTTGAKRGFVLYWQEMEFNATATEFVEKLYSQSLPLETPSEEVIQRLKKLVTDDLHPIGTPDEIAKSMVDWLGSHAVILLSNKD